jgi:hypothetical protein
MLAGAGLAACNQSGPVAKAARNSGAVPATNHPVPHANASGAPPANRPETDAPPPSSAGQAAPELPAAMRGRWGLTPMDCTSPLGDAKGLMIVGPTELRFYESRAVPTGDVQADGSSAAGTFNFRGEGQNWMKYEALKVQRDLLIRTESNPTASFTYAKCS